MVIAFVLVAALVLAVLVTANWYVWRRLFRDTTRGPGLARRAGAVLIAGGWALAITALVAERTGAPFWLQQTLAWPGFLWLALSIYLLLGVVAGEFVRPLLRWFLERRARATGVAEPGPGPAATPGAPAESGAAADAGPGSRTPDAPGGPALPAPQAEHTGAPGAVAAPVTAAAAQAAQGGGATASATAAGTAAPDPQAGLTPDAPGGAAQSLTTTSPTNATSTTNNATASGPSRRLFVSRVVAGAAAAAAVGTVGYGTYGVLRGPRVKRVTVPLAKLPRAAHGYRIAVVSDVHLGPVLGRGFAQKVVDTINGTQPDLIAVVGDLVDGSVKDLGPAAAPLAQLRARHGSYFVTGNHEYFSGAEQWVEEVRRLGLNPLENARREMPYFDLAGVNDVAGEEEGQGPDFARALGDRDTARACVLLAHQPVQIHEAVEHNVDLQLSGHTHGGQLWPGNLIAAGANPTLAGLERYGDTQLYVSRGAGAWGPPTRVGAPSDITLIELASKQA
ncbi:MULTISPECIES: metallophosphoesterase [unclassified Streptomyces]|uniref:metallophosphoesterase n=2 Tax=Streptomyces TaxID=1883 RepID=UPI0004C27DB2|nr:MULTISPECIES: metallophosphoesterase [unclassified Streptomyces]